MITSTTILAYSTHVAYIDHWSIIEIFDSTAWLARPTNIWDKKTTLMTTPFKNDSSVFFILSLFVLIPNHLI